MKSKIVLIAALAAGVSACSFFDDRLETQTVDGWKFPGTPATAKEQGITDCLKKQVSYVCRTNGPASFLGVPALRALVTITAEDNFASRMPNKPAPSLEGIPYDKLSYRGIYFVFADTKLLEKAFEMQGWVMGVTGDKDTPTAYVHEGVQAEIYLLDKTISIMPASSAEVDMQLEVHKKRIKDGDLAQAKDESFSEYMKR
ncbi:hypothetical protein HNP46_000534 [Pseudomonas nitritireducens]|uniref:Lipoprotein n=1 Tax=Pseudomonas nitroreducens TaxID=46680 RepID=A0A7W7KGL8_PSENT|nr:hypothetical protein [Pseudomonas nitritireducens]MBB4861723.1 hypothetical protein [Pseudomonas nitritireducens]